MNMLMYLIISDSSFVAIILLLFAIRFVVNVLKDLIECVGNFGSEKLRARREHKESISKDRLHSTNPEVYKDDPQFQALGKELKKFYQNKDIRNIAITGTRAAGKSSFIKTYESRNAIPFSRYMRLMPSSKLNNVDISEEEIEKYLVQQVFKYVQDRELSGKNLPVVPIKRGVPLIEGIIVAGYLASLFALYNYGKLSKVIPQQYTDKMEGYFAISCIVLILPLIWVIYRLFERIASVQSFKIKTTVGEAEIVFNGSPISDNMTNLIQALTKIRRKISYTVVIEDLENYNVGKENCRMVHTRLIELNKQLNDHLSMQGFGRFFYIPVRFLFIYRDGVYEHREEIKRFDGFIRIGGTLTISGLSHQINETLASCFNDSDRKPPSLEQGNLLLSQDYLEKLNKYISEFLLNRRWMNDVITDYGIEWKELTRKLGNRICAADETRLFSYVLYKHLFPDDQKKMNSEKSLIFSATDKKSVSDISDDTDKIDLFYYLIKECPEQYRLSPLCMRYVNFDPSLLEYYLELSKVALGETKYGDALKYITRTIICDPENAAFYNMRAEIYDKQHKHGEAQKDRDIAQKYIRNSIVENVNVNSDKTVEIDIKASEDEDIYYIQRGARLQMVRHLLDEFFREFITGNVLDQKQLEKTLNDYQLQYRKRIAGAICIYIVSVPLEKETGKSEKYDTEDVSVTILVDNLSNKTVRVHYHYFRDYVDVFFDPIHADRVLLKDFTLLRSAGIEWTDEGIGKSVSTKVFNLNNREIENLWNYKPVIDREGGDLKPFLEKLIVGMSFDIAIEAANTAGLYVSDVDTCVKCVSCASDIRGYQDGSCVYLYLDRNRQLLRDIRYYDYVALYETGKYLRTASEELSEKNSGLYEISKGYYITNDYRTQYFMNLDQSLQMLERNREKLIQKIRY